MDYETSVNKISFQTLLTMRLVLINLFWVMRCFSASFPELTTRWSWRSAVRNSPPPLPRDLDKYPPLTPQYCCCWYCSLDTATFTSHWGSQSHLFIVPFKDAATWVFMKLQDKRKRQMEPCWARYCGTFSPWSSSLVPPPGRWWSRSPAACSFWSP